MPESLNRHDAEITTPLQAPPPPFGLHVIRAADINPFTSPGDAMYPHELSVGRVRHIGIQMFSVQLIANGQISLAAYFTTTAAYTTEIST